jgi:hypothetical protein
MKAKNWIVTALALLASPWALSDVPATHGMLLFGNEVTYASHLPMFHSPHDYQVIARISLDDVPGSHALKTYEALKKKGVTFFTIVPEKADLTQVIGGIRTTLLASIYQGDFENHGKNLGPVHMHVDEVLYSARLTGRLPTKALTGSAENNQENYLVFGENGEYYSAHLIQGKPSFDQIAEVSQPYQLQATYCRTRACAETLKHFVDDSELPLTLSVPKNESTLGMLQEGDQLGDLGGPLVDVIHILFSEPVALSY